MILCGADIVEQLPRPQLRSLHVNVVILHLGPEVCIQLQRRAAAVQQTGRIDTGLLTDAYLEG